MDRSSPPRTAWPCAVAAILFLTPFAFAQSSSSSTGSASPTESSRSPATPAERRTGALVNVYFLLIAVGILVCYIVYWILNRRRKEKIARRDGQWRSSVAGRASHPDSRTARHQWTTYSDWRRRRDGPDSARVHPEDEEASGLDRWGQAPPPYKPRDPPTALLQGQHADAGVGQDAERRPSSLEQHPSVVIPLRTLSNPGALPKYEDVTRPGRDG
ncbi:MAG: hypothetical protein M1825_006175 [Sarcosagium campestre]|nr:MAG: hypothetical protein M1825_006175 [Sarcosagium campestre]